jgi:hypothetical protein
MAFITSLQSKRPKYWTLFKWVALIFLGPLAVLAFVPIIVTAIAHVWRVFFSAPATLPTTTISVFGYIDLLKIITAVLGILIVLYRLRGEAGKAIGKPPTRRTRREQVLISTVVPTVIVFAALMLAGWQTQETFTVPSNVKVLTNRIDAYLCRYFDLLRCAVPRVNCDQFGRYPDGTWVSSRDATLIYPDDPGSFGNNKLSPHSIVISAPNETIDLTEYLEKKCRYKSRLLTLPFRR